MSETVKLFVKLPVIMECSKYEDKELADILGEENKIQEVSAQWFDLLKLRSFYELKPDNKDNDTGTTITVMRGEWGAMQCVWVVMSEDDFTEMMNTHLNILNERIDKDGDQVQEIE